MGVLRCAMRDLAGCAEGRQPEWIGKGFEGRCARQTRGGAKGVHGESARRCGGSIQRAVGVDALRGRIFVRRSIQQGA
jgi:hypothetical protein